MKINRIMIDGSRTLIIGLLLISGSCQKSGTTHEPHLKLWYQHPANATVADQPNRWKNDPEWPKALPLGNGSLGAMVFGDVNKERIQLNEESMWSGSPYDNDNPDAYPAQDQIRKLLFEGKYKEASELTERTQICIGEGSGRGSGANVPFGSSQTLGDLWIDFENGSNYENYHRELDLEEAVARVRYTQDEVEYQREIFVSQPNQVMVIQLTANKPGKISCKCSIDRPERYTTTATDDQLFMRGALADGQGGEGLQYMARLSAVNKNGTVSYENEKLTVENADEVILFLTASTDYILKYPNYKGRDFETITATNLQKAKQTSYEELLKKHKKDYQQYYKRVSLQLTSEVTDTIPTDIRLQKFKETKSDPRLVELLFQYGRTNFRTCCFPGKHLYST